MYLSAAIGIMMTDHFFFCFASETTSGLNGYRGIEAVAPLHRDIHQTSANVPGHIAPIEKTNKNSNDF